MWMPPHTHCTEQRAQDRTPSQRAVASYRVILLWQLTPDLERPAATSPNVETEQVCCRGVELRKQWHSPATPPHDGLDLTVGFANSKSYCDTACTGGGGKLHPGVPFTPP